MTETTLRNYRYTTRATGPGGRSFEVEVTAPTLAEANAAAWLWFRELGIADDLTSIRTDKGRFVRAVRYDDGSTG